MSPRITLRDGRQLPRLGLGCYQIPPDKAAEIVTFALDHGYRAFDTAAVYNNESQIGDALRASGVPRNKIFLTTKIWIDRLSFDGAHAGLDWCLKRLGLDHVDLCLIHWPGEGYAEAWRGLQKLRDEGLARSIGVSNFTPDNIEHIVRGSGEAPAVNQIELHPRWPQRGLRAVHNRHGIATQSWAPLGRTSVLDDPLLQSIADKHGKTPGQILIRWHIDNDIIVIPKSLTPSRIVDNIDVFDFSLDEDDLRAIATFERADGRIGPDPALPHPSPHFRSPENRA